jgi:hypothetical protein
LLFSASSSSWQSRPSLRPLLSGHFFSSDRNVLLPPLAQQPGKGRCSRHFSCSMLLQVPQYALQHATSAVEGGRQFRACRVGGEQLLIHAC